ncbi:MAG TPA: hypothetical protein VGG80_10530, partial [Acidobacteriaceae bacterium]
VAPPSHLERNTNERVYIAQSAKGSENDPHAAGSSLTDAHDNALVPQKLSSRRKRRSLLATTASALLAATAMSGAHRPSAQSGEKDPHVAGSSSDAT